MLPLLVSPVSAHAATPATTRIANFTAGPASVVKGRNITYSGQVQRASGPTWLKTGAVTIKVYFDPDGAAPKKLVKTLKTSSTGYFKSATPGTLTGRWSVQMAGQGSYKGSATAAKAVKVTVSKPVPKPLSTPVPRPTAAKPVSKWNCPSWAPIKGNAPSKIYHLRGQAFYDRTTPEQCFATEAAAVKAGFRKSKR